jgi:catechol 2,3-dioxygenase
MPVQMRLGPPTLKVRNLAKTLSFYRQDLGLRIRRGRPDTKHELTGESGFPKPIVGLGSHHPGYNHSTTSLVNILHDPDAKPAQHDSAGLYHYAMLVPDRKSLASTYLAIAKTGLVYEGFADHTVSESLYLRDNENNGIEIYADRPRDTWAPFMELMKKGGSNDIQAFVSLNKPLDLDSLLRELRPEERNKPEPFPGGVRIGHIHLRVTNLQQSVKFYHEKLGLDIVGNLPSIGAAFLSAGGYHHHIGMNTWHSENGRRHEHGEAGLENFTIYLPDQPSIDKLAKHLRSSVKTRNINRLTIFDPDGVEIDIRAENPNKTPVSPS